MNDAKTNPQHAVNAPLLALLFASFIGIALVALRITWTHHWRFLSLIWNLFLAWLPLLFALAVHRRHQRGERRDWRFFSLATLWLLFFPNAPYIFTDLIHLTSRHGGVFWADLCVVLLFALTGFLLGFVSLYLMQNIVTEHLGRMTGWLFTLAVALIGGFGIYLGRFLRWNSWDVLVHPWDLSHSIGHLAIHPFAEPRSLIFSALFATFLFLGYLMLYALTHLQPTATPREVEI